MTVIQISQISVSIQIAVLAVLLGLTVRLVGESARNLTAVFLSFSFGLWLLTDLYWLIYDLMRPEIRMPFAANEIGEAALFLFCKEFRNHIERLNNLPCLVRGNFGKHFVSGIAVRVVIL